MGSRADRAGQGRITLGNLIQHLVTSKGEWSVLVTCNPLILKHICIELHTKQEQRSQPLGFLGDTSCSGPQSVSLLASTPAPVCKNGYARQQIMGWLKDSNTHTHKVGMGPTTSLLSPTPHKTILTQGWKQCMTTPPITSRKPMKLQRNLHTNYFEGNMRIYSHDWYEAACVTQLFSKQFRQALERNEWSCHNYY
jgi:hypothetical protein